MNDGVLKYKRVLLKLSGEALLGAKEYGIDYLFLKEIVEELKEISSFGVELAIVIGGGNIFRGVAGAKEGLDRARADYMGMLATLINALALQDSLEKQGLSARTLTALKLSEVAEPYIREKALSHLEKGRILILACGTGNPFFTTDTAAVLRALELNCKILLKATKVDGVYEEDPLKNPYAQRFEDITFKEVLNRNLKVMDATAFSLAKDHNLPILVFNLFQRGHIKKAVFGEKVGTLIRN